MARINSKNKGSSFEREVSKILDDWFNMEKGFSRSAGSGSRFGGKNSVNLNIHNRSASKAQLGDIQTPDSVDVLIECKSYKSIPFHSVIIGRATKIDDWLSQLKDDRETFYQVFKERLATILFFKVNNFGVYVVFSYRDVIRPIRRYSIPYTVYYHTHNKKVEKHIIVSLKNIDQNIVKELNKKMRSS